MSWVEYVASRPTEPMKFRVKANLSDYYNYEFYNARPSYWSIQLRESTGYQTLHGYVSKESEDGKKLFEMLKRGENRNIIVQTRFLSNRYPGGDVVVIDSLISDSWVEY